MTLTCVRAVCKAKKRKNLLVVMFDVFQGEKHICSEDSSLHIETIHIMSTMLQFHKLQARKYFCLKAPHAVCFGNMQLFLPLLKRASTLFSRVLVVIFLVTFQFRSFVVHLI